MKWAPLVLSFALASRCTGEDADRAETRKAAPAAAKAASERPRIEQTSLDVIGQLGSCDIDHAGLFLDLGTPAVDPRRDHAVGPFPDAPAYERAGATFARLLSRRVAYDFGVLEPMEHVAVSMRVAGVASRMASVYVDDRRVGIVSLPREEPGVVSAPRIDELGVGTHTVTLRFTGSTQGADEPFAEVDWIRIGTPDEVPQSYAPPTLGNIVSDVVLDGEPRRAVVLRSPSIVRCALRVAPGTKLRTNVGYWGNGRGVATIRVVEDGEQPAVLSERKVSGGTGAAWTPLTLDLGPYAGRVVGIELSASESSGGGRVAFGEPVFVSSPAEVPRVPRAKVAVVVLAAGLDRRMIPPWGPVASLPALGKLVRDGVAFDRYRTPTTVVGATVASLLTGVPPRAHGLEDPSARLGEDVRLIGERAKEGSAHAAFFTGVPMSFPAFGFDRGWDRYDSFSPVKDVPATEPYAAAAAWLKEQLAADRDGKALLVIHVRGGHPPWDVTRDETAPLPPEEYNGPLEPRAGAIVLSNLRSQRGPADQRLSGADWRRLHALEETALKKQDAGLRRLLDTLEREGLYDDALIVFMGDVAVGDPPGIPFAPAPPLREDVLLAPLIVKFPRNALAGAHVETMATTVDVTGTIVRALELADDGIDGVDLFQTAKGVVPIEGRPLVATLGTRYATRFGPWLLSGEFGRRPTLCLIDVDPACATDAFAQSPLAAAALWRRTYELELRARTLRNEFAHGPGTLALDQDTQAALKVFGY